MTGSSIHFPKEIWLNNLKYMLCASLKKMLLVSKLFGNLLARSSFDRALVCASHAWTRVNCEQRRSANDELRLHPVLEEISAYLRCPVSAGTSIISVHSLLPTSVVVTTEYPLEKDRNIQRDWKLLHTSIATESAIWPPINIAFSTSTVLNDDIELNIEHLSNRLKFFTVSDFMCSVINT